MDSLDVAIIRAMGLQPYGRAPRHPENLSPRLIAKRLGAKRDTVRDRIGRMETSGAIAGYEIFPNLRHLGLGAAGYLLRLKDERVVDGLAERLEPFDGLIDLDCFLGGSAIVSFTSRGRGEEERKLRLLRRLLGEAEVLRVCDLEYPGVSRTLGPLDWRIIRALRGDARRPLGEVAKQLRMSARTVKRRFDRMGREGDIFVIPAVDPSRVPGLILCEFLFEFDAGVGVAIAAEIQGALEQRLVCMDGRPAPGGPCFGAGLYATSVGEIEEMRLKVARLSGVKRVETLVLARNHEQFGWLDEAIDAAAGRVERGNDMPEEVRR